MKKLVTTAAGLALLLLSASPSSALAATGFKFTSSELAVTVTDTNLADGIAAGYTSRNLVHRGSVNVFDPVAFESFSADTPDIVPMDALVETDIIHASTAATGKLGGFTMELGAEESIADRQPGNFFDGGFEARQVFVLQPHTTLTLSGRYEFDLLPDSRTIPVDGGKIWINPTLSVSAFASQSQGGVSVDFYGPVQRDFTLQLTNNSDIASEQYIKYVSYSHLSTRFIPVSSVPEPATWGMMGAGLGMLALRNRRRRSVRA